MSASKDKVRKSPRKRANNRRRTESGTNTSHRRATVSHNRIRSSEMPTARRGLRSQTKLSETISPKSELMKPASFHTPFSSTKRKREPDDRPGAQVDGERSEYRFASKRRRLPHCRHELSEANMSQLERVSQQENETDGDAFSLKRRNSRRSVAAASDIDTVRSQRSSTATSSYRYKDLAASEIHLHSELPKDIEDAVNDILNSKITKQRRADISIISQQFSNNCRDNVAAYSGEDDFIDPLHTAIKAFGFKHLCMHEKADWREELKPVAPRNLEFSSSFMAVVDQLAEENTQDQPRKRQQRDDSQGPNAIPPSPPTIFLGKKDRTSIKTPRPDISIGIKLSSLTSALSSQNLNPTKAKQFLSWMQSEIVQQIDGPSEPMLISIPAPRARDLAFPFAVVESKAYSTGKQIFEAENQAAVSAACALKIQLDLDDLVEHARASSGACSEPLEIKPALFFSICTQGPIHELWVHWTTIEDEVRMFQSGLMDSCNALLHRQAEDFLAKLNNVALWGTGPFMESVVDRLGIVAKLAKPK